MEVIIFVIVLSEKEKPEGGKKRDTGAKQTGDRLSPADTEQTGK